VSSHGSRLAHPNKSYGALDEERAGMGPTFKT
jgi:hypothetical protein